MPIDLTSLNKAIARLEIALVRHAGNTSDEEVRDSVIQRFEFTYDLSIKMLRRVIEATSIDVAELADLTFPALIRTAWEQKLLSSEWPAWQEFRSMRNITSHTYDQAKAIDIAAKVPAFFREAQLLIERLQTRISE